MTVSSAISIASSLGIDEIVIGLSVIAIGTSLPELVTVIAGLWKKHHDMAIGNILSSNLFNGLGVIGATVLVQPLAIDLDVISRDFSVGAGLTLLLLFLIFAKPGKQLTPWKGSVLIACFAGYIYWLYYSELFKA